MPESEWPEKDTGTVGLDSLIEACIEKYNVGRATAEEEILENWERIVGKDFASRSRPEKITASGYLIIQVPNPTLRREMIFLEGRILTALGSLPKCHHVNRIIFKGGS